MEFMGMGEILMGTMNYGDNTLDKVRENNYVVNNLWDIDVVTQIIVKFYWG